MVYMKLHCGACGGTWEVYRRQRDTAAARACPHCDYTIDRETWAKKVLPAFQAVGAANMALASDHEEKHTAEFSIDYIADMSFQNAGRADLLNEFTNRLGAIEERLDMLSTDAIKQAFFGSLGNHKV